MTSPTLPAARLSRFARAAVAATAVLVAGVGASSAAAQAADPAPTLAITGLSGHYHSGGTVSLAVTQTPDTGNSHYHWYHQCGTATDWTVVPGASKTMQLTAAPALHRCKVVVRLFGDAHAVVAESAPATIDIDDHGTGPAMPTVAVTGAKAHYHSGDALDLAAAITPAPATLNAQYRWYQRCGAETAWSPVADAKANLPLTVAASPALDGCQVLARHFSVASEPVTIHVEDHAPVETALTVGGLRDHYHPGDPITLKAQQSPATGLDHWHWFVRCGDRDWTIEPSNATDTWTATADLRHEGCLVQAKLYGHDHEVVAESAPVTLRVRDHAATPVDPVTPGTPAPAPTPAPVSAPAPARTPAPAPAVVPASSVAVTPSAVRSLATLRRQGVLRSTVRLNGAGRVTVKATIPASAARRAGLRVPKGTRTVTLGTATTTKTKAGSAVVRIKLATKHRRALGKVRGTLRITLAATVRSADGTVVRNTRRTTVRG
jgi:hypothetical protein